MKAEAKTVSLAKPVKEEARAYGEKEDKKADLSLK